MVVEFAGITWNYGAETRCTPDQGMRATLCQWCRENLGPADGSDWEVAYLRRSTADPLSMSVRSYALMILTNREDHHVMASLTWG